MARTRRPAGTALFAAAVALALVSLSTMTARGTTPSEGVAMDSQSVGEHLAGIRQELQSIARLLGSLETHQRVSALMARLELKQRRMSGIEAELRQARDEKEGAESEIARLTGIEQSWTRDAGGAFDEDSLSEDERRGLELMRQERQSLTSRVERLGMRMVDLENDLAAAKDDILTLEEIVDEQLGLR